MQKRVTIIVLVLSVLLVLGVGIGAYLYVYSGFGTESADLADRISETQSDIDALEAQKDTNGYTPLQVVEAFWSETQSESTAEAQLYLSPDVQSMDINATLKLGSDYSNIVLGESFTEESGNVDIVYMTFVLSESENTVRSFNLEKFDGAWKITGIIAE